MLRSWGGGAAFTAASDMSSTLQAARQISSRVRRCSLLPAVATTQRHGKHDNQGNKCCATYSTLSNTRGSSAACGRTLRLKSTASKHGYHSQFFQSMSSRSTVAHVPARPSSGEGGTAGSYRRAAFVGPVRAFGGQSVVPWELALFLVEEMKAEMVPPGAVVYTAALAECRWAGEQKHVDYLLQEMEAEGLTIVPGIPGATDDELPPSQAPPLFGKLPEVPPSSSGKNVLQHQPSPGASTAAAATADHRRNNPSIAAATATATASGAIAAMQAAARTADTALATVETMWARELDEPSPATCRAVLDACAAGGQWERALALVRDAAMAIGTPDCADADDGVGAGDENVSGMVEALALEGKWNEALSLAQGKSELS